MVKEKNTYLKFMQTYEEVKKTVKYYEIEKEVEKEV